MTNHAYLSAEWKLSGGEAMTFSGYGAAFGNRDSYGDVIAPGAFAKSLSAAKTSGAWPPMLLQHGGMIGSADDMTPIGIWTDMAEDGKGLWVEGKLAPTARGNDAYTLLKMQPRPAISGLSIGYNVAPEDIVSGRRPKEPRRILKSVSLIEVSLVTFPANSRARVDAVKGAPNEIRELERLLCDAGYSRSEAKTIIGHGFKALKATRDAGDGATTADALRKLLSTITA